MTPSRHESGPVIEAAALGSLDWTQALELAGGSPKAWKALEGRMGGVKLATARGLTAEGRRLRAVLVVHMEHVERAARWGPKPALTVDGVLIENGKILLVRRGADPYKGMHALPGGFVEFGETVEQAVVREVREETGLEVEASRLVGVYSAADRDPRGHTVGVAFLVNLIGGTLEGGDDAESAEFVDIKSLPALAFDHRKIVNDACALAGRTR